MKVKIVPIFFMLTSCQILKTETLDCAHEYNINHKITISNNASTPLSCTQYQLSEKENRESEAELEIDPKSSKSVKMCSYTDWMYCSLIIDQDTYTFPTNFQPYQSGEYKVNLVEVPSSDTNEFFGCGASKIPKPSWCQNTPGTRMSTEVELPNGKKIYK